jgi:hypothetical protein
MTDLIDPDQLGGLLSFSWGRELWIDGFGTSEPCPRKVSCVAQKLKGRNPPWLLPQRDIDVVCSLHLRAVEKKENQRT